MILSDKVYLTFGYFVKYGLDISNILFEKSFIFTLTQKFEESYFESSESKSKYIAWFI